MKITISNYEGEPDYRCCSCEMDNEANLDRVIDGLEGILRQFFGDDLILDVRRKGDDDA